MGNRYFIDMRVGIDSAVFDEDLVVVVCDDGLHIKVLIPEESEIEEHECEGIRFVVHHPLTKHTDSWQATEVRTGAVIGGRFDSKSAAFDDAIAAIHVVGAPIIRSGVVRGETMLKHVKTITLEEYRSRMSK